MPNAYTDPSELTLQQIQRLHSALSLRDAKRDLARVPQPHQSRKCWPSVLGISHGRVSQLHTRYGVRIGCHYVQANIDFLHSELYLIHAYAITAEKGAQNSSQVAGPQTCYLLKFGARFKLLVK
jgi:hypothetical protein